jgi:hypothetical protein
MNWGCDDTPPVGSALPAAQVNPTSHSPLQSAEDRPATAPYLPAGHARHTDAPAALHRPGGHGPSHVALTRAGPDPTCPPLQSTHADAPAPLHRPAGHSPVGGVGDPDPGLHA